MPFPLCYDERLPTTPNITGSISHNITKYHNFSPIIPPIISPNILPKYVVGEYSSDFSRFSHFPLGFVELIVGGERVQNEHGGIETLSPLDTSGDYMGGGSPSPTPPVPLGLSHAA